MLVGGVANHLALALSHQRLAEQARSSAELTARTGNFDLLDELLTAVTGLGGLPEVWARSRASFSACSRMTPSC